jgi:hypothetical protein
VATTCSRNPRPHLLFAPFHSSISFPLALSRSVLALLHFPELRALSVRSDARLRNTTFRFSFSHCTNLTVATIQRSAKPNWLDVSL